MGRLIPYRKLLLISPGLIYLLKGNGVLGKLINGGVYL